MVRLRTLLFVSLMLAGASSQATATVIFTATLDGAQEAPPNASTASGSGILVLNDPMDALTYDFTIFDLDFTGLQTPADPGDDLIAAHIHAPAPPGVNAVIVFGFIAPSSDDNPPDLVITPFLVGVGGTISGKWDLNEGINTTLAAQVPNLLAGNAYVNFHTRDFPGGEIRGQILAQSVPEPATLALLGIGSIGLIARRWRSQMRVR
jgi:hypothetical protein